MMSEYQLAIVFVRVQAVPSASKYQLAISFHELLKHFGAWPDFCLQISPFLLFCVYHCSQFTVEPLKKDPQTDTTL